MSRCLMKLWNKVPQGENFFEAISDRDECLGSIDLHSYDYLYKHITT